MRVRSTDQTTESTQNLSSLFVRFVLATANYLLLCFAFVVFLIFFRGVNVTVSLEFIARSAFFRFVCAYLSADLRAIMDGLLNGFLSNLLSDLKKLQ